MMKLTFWVALFAFLAGRALDGDGWWGFALSFAVMLLLISRQSWLWRIKQKTALIAAAVLKEQQMRPGQNLDEVIAATIDRVDAGLKNGTVKLTL